MTKSELVAQYRIDSEDRIEPYLATSAMVTAWLNEAEEEAAIRSHLLREVSNPDLCQIAVTVLAGNTYPLHEAMVWITRADFIPAGQTASDAINLQMIGHTELDRIFPCWRTTTEQPRFLMVNDNTVQLGCLPQTDGTLKLEGCRVPLDKMEDRVSESPEINRAHHRHLVLWALHRNYSRPDTQVFDKDRAQKALGEFERIFGARPDGRLRRDIEQDRHHSNKAW